MNLDDIRPCNAEEADERMLLRVNHAAKQFSKHLIKTVDSDVIVISVTVFNQLQGVNELWIEFGRGKTLKYIPIHEIVNSLGKVNSRAVSFLHALSGCDTTSAVAGKGKLSFYNTWSQLPEITPTFAKLGNVTDVNLVTDDDFTHLFYTQPYTQHRISIQEDESFILREVNLLKISHQHSIASRSKFIDLATRQRIGLMPF